MPWLTVMRTLVVYGLLGAIAAGLLSAGATHLWPRPAPKPRWIANLYYGPTGQPQAATPTATPTPAPAPAVTYSYVTPPKQTYAERFRLAVPIEPPWLGWTLNIALCGGVLLVMVRLPGILIAGRRRELGRCAGCGYDVGGLSQRGRCPECGRPISPRHER